MVSLSKILEEWIKEKGNFEHLLSEIHLTIRGIRDEIIILYKAIIFSS